MVTSRTRGEMPPPRRAHKATLVDRKIYVFRGGERPTCYNDVYALDTLTQWWYKPNIPSHHPLTRRAHTMVLYCDTIYLLGGENGHRELNDVWALDASVGMEKLTWDEVQTYDGTKSGARGHHAAKLVGKVMIVFEGAVEGSVSRMFGSWILTSSYRGK